MQELTGVRQFSHTSGWKTASNALYLYEHVYKNDKTPIPEKFSGVDSLVRDYFDKPHEKVDLLHVDISAGSYYKSVGWSPLMIYMYNQYKDKEFSDFKKLAVIAPFYKDYGNYIIRKHPIAFLKHVVWPSTQIYLIPWPEIYTINYPAFYIWEDGLGIAAKKWFGLKTLLIPEKYIIIRSKIMDPFPLIFAIIHILFLLSMASFIIFNGSSRIKREFLSSMLIIITACIINFFFFIVIAPSVLRFQLPIIILELFSIMFFLEYLYYSENNSYPLLKNRK